MIKKDKIYELKIEEDDEISGIDSISLVDEPAIEINWMFFNKTKQEDFHIPDGEDELYLEKLMKYGQSEEEFLSEGWEFVKVIENQKDNFYTTNPNDDSRLDTDFYRVRFKYDLSPNISQSPIISTTRDFCKTLIQQNRVWRNEDIEAITNDFGDSARMWRGGFNCRHRWFQVLYKSTGDIINKSSVNKDKITGPEGVPIQGTPDFAQPATVTNKTLGNPSQSTVRNLGLSKDKFAKISIDYDNILSTQRGKDFARRLINEGNDLYIVTKRRRTESNDVYRDAQAVGISRDRVFFTEGRVKWMKLKELGIQRHIDNNPDEIADIKKNAPLIRADKFEVGVPHYTKDGKLYEGPTHKGPDGRLMTGAVHTEDSENLYHEDELAVVGPRGGIVKAPKAPDSKTPNKDPKGEGSAKGDASGRGAKVSAEQEKTLQKKVDDFNEKDSNTKYGRATLGQLKSVFQRGLGAFNTSHSPVVKSAEQWAYARVNAYLYLLKNGRPENPKYDTDYDLLGKDHPKADMSSEKFIECKECGHSWDMEDGGIDVYICHKCGYDNTSEYDMDYDVSGIVGYQDPGIKKKKKKQNMESYSDYPDSVKNNAKAVLKYVEENGWGDCGTNIGRGRATDLANGSPISEDTIQRMYSYLSRHKVDLESSKSYDDGCGKLMYDAWGGLSALSWAESKINSFEKEQMSRQKFVTDDEKRIVVGPAMVPDLKIFRKDKEGNPYYVVFKEDTIKMIMEKYMRNKYTDNNDENHDGNAVKDVYVIESWIKEDMEDKSNKYGYNELPIGTWFVSMKVRNDEVWKKVKNGELNGFSVSGWFEEVAMFCREEMFLRQVAEILKKY